MRELWIGAREKFGAARAGRDLDWTSGPERWFLVLMEIFLPRADEVRGDKLVKALDPACNWKAVQGRGAPGTLGGKPFGLCTGVVPRSRHGLQESIQVQRHAEALT